MVERGAARAGVRQKCMCHHYLVDVLSKKSNNVVSNEVHDIVSWPVGQIVMELAATGCNLLLMWSEINKMSLTKCAFFSLFLFVF